MTLKQRVYRLMRSGFRGTDVEVGAMVGATRHVARSMISAINADQPGSIKIKKVRGQRKGVYEHTSPIRVPANPTPTKSTISVPHAIKVEVSGVQFTYALVGPV